MAKVKTKVKTSKAGNKAVDKSPVLKEISRLYDFMRANQLETLEFNGDEMRVRLVRKRQPVAPVPVLVSADAAGAPKPSAVEAARPAAEPVPEGTSCIKSPLTGIFYRAPSPSAPPFVREGETIKAGHVVCLIEAMKVFNEVKADCDCTIAKMLIENGKPVKTGQDLILCRKT